MKKIKLFMMLALLVAGVNGAWAQQYIDYGLVYSPSDLEGVGFSVIESTIQNGVTINTSYTWSGGTHAGEQLISVEGTDSYWYALTPENISSYIEPKAIDGYNSSITVSQVTRRNEYSSYYGYCNYVIVIRYTPKFHSETYTVQSNITGGGIQSTGNWPHNETATLSSDGKTLTISNANNNAYAPVVLANWNVNNYIVPKTVTGYNVAITVEGSTIKLNYYQTWTKDGLEYSTFHIQSTNNQGMMDSKFDFISGQPEVAVRLHLDKTKIVTDTVKYEKPLWANPTKNEKKTLTDDDGDGVGINAEGNANPGSTNAEYTYIGQLDYDQTRPMNRDYFYLRRHAIAYSERTSVTIPREVTFGTTTYKVTAIQKWGMDYAQTHVWRSDYCYNMKSEGESNPDKTTKAWEHQNINDHRNEYLKTVTFEMSATNPSNIHSIGDYAFMSLFNSSINPKYTGLEEIVIPNSTTYLGTGAFEMCLRLKDVTFQKVFDTTDPDYDKTRINAIRDYTFYSCIRLGEINLPIGIETIGNCAFQYNFQMTKIELPNGLTSVGDHFLCCASSLRNVTFPYSMTHIAGACFHGCESLENVYLMGPASALIKESGSGGTFDANPRFCKEHVQDCTFWVFNEYYDGYKNDEVWSEIDENGQHSGTYNSHSCVNGNWLRIVPDETRTFEADKWVTAIFPNGVENYKTAFPANGDKQTRVARMTSATVTEGVEKDPKTGRPLRMYNLTFELITGNDIPAGVPLMICPATLTEITLYTANQSANDPDFKDHMTDKHPVEVSCGEKGKVVMKGQYSPYDLQKWDFFFAYPQNSTTAKFYRVPEGSNYQVDRCRCWWTIEAEGVKINSSASPSAKGFSFFDDATGINNVETRIAIDAIYDLNGRKIDIDPASLPKGMYIKNGKKYIKN